MKEFVKKNWLWLLNILLIISVLIQMANGNSIMILFTFIASYLVGFFTSKKLFGNKDFVDGGY